MILAGDFGGTKTILALFSPQEGVHKPLLEQTFPSASYATPEALVEDFLQQNAAQMTEPIGSACFGVAGPVIGGQAHITNLDWIIDEARLRTTLRIDALELINDLAAIAYAVPALGAEDLHTLHAGEPAEHGTIAIIAPGTGLGEAFLTWDGARYRANPSEGGHVTFAPTNPEELEMLAYLWQRYEHVSYERVCSGMGLPNIYAFFRDRGTLPELPHVAAQLAAAEEKDQTRIIMSSALDPDQPSALCRRTLETFVAILGSEAGNLALKVLATGGIYIGGGIPPRIIELLRSQTQQGSPPSTSRTEESERAVAGLLESLRTKGRFVEFLRRVPVHVILNPRAALIGAARHGLML